MKIASFRVFNLVAFVTTPPLVLLMLFFHDDARKGWIANLALVVLFSYALAGAVASFLKYVVHGRTVQCGTTRRRIFLYHELLERPRKWFTRLRVFMKWVVLLWAVALVACGILFVRCFRNDIPIAPNLPFEITKAGSYTLWAAGNDGDLGRNRFRLVSVSSSNSVLAHPVLGSITYNKNGQEFIPVTVYEFAHSGTFSLLTEGEHSPDLLLTRSISPSFVIFVGALLAIVCAFPILAMLPYLRRLGILGIVNSNVNPTRQA